MTYLEKIQQITEKNKERKQDELLDEVLEEIEKHAQEGENYIVFYKQNCSVENLNYIIDYFKKEGFSVDKKHLPLIQINW